MSRITIDLKKRANTDERVHYGLSSDPTMADEGGRHTYPYQLSSMRFRDPREYTQRRNPGDSDTVADMDTAEVTADETSRPTSRGSDGDKRPRISHLQGSSPELTVGVR